MNKPWTGLVTGLPPKPGARLPADYQSPETLRERSWWLVAPGHRLARREVQGRQGLRCGQRTSRQLASCGPDHVGGSLQATPGALPTPVYSRQRALPTRDTPRRCDDARAITHVTYNPVFPAVPAL